MAASNETLPVPEIRRRRPSDIPALVDVLLAQQPASRYPLRNPLPFPAEQFLHADDAVGAWVAELGGQVAGHVCRIGRPQGLADAVTMKRECAAAHGCVVDELAWVSTLFVSLDARGCGIGRLLLSTVVDDIGEAGLYPCLEVLPYDPAALRLYESTGWREVTRLRPDWLRQEVGDAGPDVVVMALASGRPREPAA